MCLGTPRHPSELTSGDDGPSSDRGFITTTVHPRRPHWTAREKKLLFIGLHVAGTNLLIVSCSINQSITWFPAAHFCAWLCFCL
jgi:hypothetical protein